MGKRAILLIKESDSCLKTYLSRQKSLRGEKRIKALIRIKGKKDNTRQDLADYLQIHIRTLERWINTYKSEGLESMLKDKPKNKQSKIITQEIHDGLSARVYDVNNSFLGYWDAQRWVAAEYGVEVKYQRIREYLIKHFGTKVKSPRRSHVKKDKDAESSFLKTT